MWVADDSTERRQGLRLLEELPEGIDGMMFLFDPPGVPTFTTQETLMALDLWYFSPAGELVSHVPMEPCTEINCPLYPASGPVGYALETPAGTYSFEEGTALSTSG